jgi:hypothetical protein
MDLGMVSRTVLVSHDNQFNSLEGIVLLFTFCTNRQEYFVLSSLLLSHLLWQQCR